MIIAIVQLIIIVRIGIKPKIIESAIAVGKAAAASLNKFWLQGSGIAGTMLTQ